MCTGSNHNNMHDIFSLAKTGIPMNNICQKSICQKIKRVMNDPRPPSELSQKDASNGGWYFLTTFWMFILFNSSKKN